MKITGRCQRLVLAVATFAAVALGALAPSPSVALEIKAGSTFAKSHAPVPQAFEGFVLPGWTQGAFSGSGYEEWVDTLRGEPNVNQAGGHPDSTVSFAIGGASGEPDGSTKDVVIELPPGAVINPRAVPECESAEFNLSLLGHCPVGSQVGVAAIETSGVTTLAPLSKLSPGPGEPLAVGFKVLGYSVVMHPRVRTESDYGFTVEARDIPAPVALGGATLTLWGVPYDPIHDSHRFDTEVGALGASVSGPLLPLTSAPTSCETGTLGTTLKIRSWGSPGHSLAEDVTAPEQAGCGAIEFEPQASARPTTDVADSPTGLAVDIRIPQVEACEAGPPVECGLATSHLKETTLTLPEGIALNPSGANGLAGCSSSEIGLTTPLGSRPIHFTTAPVDCPDTAKVGTAEVETPLLDAPLSGTVYLADPFDNPFDSLLAIYIVFESPQRGVLAKLAVRVSPDPVDGQLTASLEDAPPLPIERVSFDLKQGPHALLRTPVSCGGYSSVFGLTPYSAPSSPVVVRDGWSIARGPAGGCERPAAPEFEAGAVRPIAGIASSFVAKLRLRDGEKKLRSLAMELPPGLVANFSGIPLCQASPLPTPEALIGRDVDPCPAASRIGSDVISVGAGVEPYFLPKGPIYLAGPYRGAPYSLVIVAPASARPFNLGSVVTRAAVNIDPSTAQARIDVDPLPQILRGIPISYRSIYLTLDRAGLIRNPTSCEPARITASATTAGETVQLSSRFQVADCAVLDFEPRLAMRLFGNLGRNGHPGLRALLRTDANEAGLRALSLKFPPGELLDLRHFRAFCSSQLSAELCPDDSRLGYARLWTPLSATPLEGPIYLRTPSRRLPDLLADLRGDHLHILLHGRTLASGGSFGIRFAALPDIPLSRGLFTLAGGRRGIFVNSESLCAHPSRAHVAFRAHSGRRRRLSPRFRPRGGC
jgi:hypothetical protein